MMATAPLLICLVLAAGAAPAADGGGQHTTYATGDLLRVADPESLPPEKAPGEEGGGDSSDLSRGADLIDRGARLLLRGLLDEAGPALRDLQRDFTDTLRGFELDPAWSGLLEVLREPGAFHPPEILPGGDILLRRKVPLPPVPAEPEGEEIEL